MEGENGRGTPPEQNGTLPLWGRGFSHVLSDFTDATEPSPRKEA
jgi:hypothetical protein